MSDFLPYATNSGSVTLGALSGRNAGTTREEQGVTVGTTGDLRGGPIIAAVTRNDVECAIVRTAVASSRQEK